MVVTHRRQAGRRDHHHFAPATDFALCHITKGLYDDGRFLLQVMRMQFFEAPNGLDCLDGRHFGVVRRILGDLEAGFIGGVVLQHIEDKALLYGLSHGVDMEWMECAVCVFLAEHLQRLFLRCGGEGKETQILVLAVGDKLPHKAVLSVLQLVLRLALDIGIFLQRVMGIRQCHFQLHSTVSRLAAVGLVHDDRKRLTLCIVHFLIDNWELLQRGHNDTLAGVERIPQVAGVHLLADGHNGAERMVKAGNRFLKLGVQHGAVCHNDHGAENGLVVRIVKTCQPVGRPSDRVGLAGAGTVLHKVVVSGAVLPHIPYQLPDNVHLVIAREDNGFLDDFLFGAVFQPNLFLLHLEADELLQNIQQTVFLENLSPQIGSHIVPIRAGRIACAAVLSGAVAALIERQEKGLGAIQLCGHSGFVQVYREERQDTVVQAEGRFLGVTVEHPLVLTVVDVLPRNLVLQLDGNDGDTVDRQHHIYAVAAVFGVVPLADALADILLIVSYRRIVQRGLRLEVADTEVDTPVLEAVPQHRNKAIVLHGIFKRLVEFLFRISVTLLLQTLPRNRLRGLHEVRQSTDIQRHTSALRRTVASV